MDGGERRCKRRVLPLTFTLGFILASAPPIAHGRSLRFVTLLYRHGDRSPVKTYPRDPYQESAWPQGFGQLSQEAVVLLKISGDYQLLELTNKLIAALFPAAAAEKQDQQPDRQRPITDMARQEEEVYYIEGMQQQWDLGRALRRRYYGFLNASYNRQEIFVRSTDFDRTLMSAEANLAGLYPPEGQQVFNPNISWQPVPVHTVPDDMEKLLRFPLSPCPRYEQLQNETRQTPEYINMTLQNMEFLKMVANMTGIQDVSLESVWSVHDALFCEKMHKMHLPAWVTPVVMAKLKELKDFSFNVLFGIHRRVEKARLQGGVLLSQIRKNLTLATKDSAPHHLKMLMYSAHDTTLAALQTALNVYNGKQPPYASCHIFELYQEDDGKFTVEMFFRNESRKEPYELQLPDCTRRCPLPQFLQLTEPVISQDWKEECQIIGPMKDTEFIMILAVCGSLLFLMTVLLLTVLFCAKAKPPGYSHLSSEGEEQP